MIASVYDHERQWMSETCQGAELLVSDADVAAGAFREQCAGVLLLYVDASNRGLVAAFVTAEGRIDFSRTLLGTPALKVRGNNPVAPLIP